MLPYQNCADTNSIASKANNGTSLITAPSTGTPNTPLPPPVVSGKTYYISNTNINPNASDTNTGLINFPWRTFTKAWQVLQPGDALIVADGSYTNVSPPPEKSGLLNNSIIIQAANAGKVIFDVLLFRGNSYLTFVGFRINGTSAAVGITSNGTGKTSHDLVFQQIGFSCTPNTLNNGSCFGLSDGTHHVTLEDSWGWGGGRYTILCYGGPGGSPPNLGCSQNTFRRLVLRQGPTQSGAGEPQASLSLYYAENNVVENVIAIDGRASSNSSNSAFYVTGHAAPPTSNGNKFSGAMAINNLGYGLYIDCPGAICDNLEVYNSVFWGSQYSGISIYVGSAVGESVKNVIIDHNTIGLSGGDGYSNYGGTVTFTNNLLYKNGRYGASQNQYYGSTTAHHNGFYLNTSLARNNIAVGAGDLTSNPNLISFVKIEPTSSYFNAGSSGNIGATIALWPWPFEDRIKREMCTDAGISTGFCSSTKTLSNYILEIAP